MPTKFCPECANRLHPRESRATRTLVLACRMCGHTETPHHPEKPIYIHEVQEDTEVDVVLSPELLHDPTLQRTHGRHCPICHHDELLAIGTTHNPTTALALVFMCTNTTCHHHFTESPNVRIHCRIPQHEDHNPHAARQKRYAQFAYSRPADIPPSQLTQSFTQPTQPPPSQQPHSYQPITHRHSTYAHAKPIVEEKREITPPTTTPASPSEPFPYSQPRIYLTEQQLRQRKELEGEDEMKRIERLLPPDSQDTCTVTSSPSRPSPFQEWSHEFQTPATSHHYTQPRPSPSTSTIAALLNDEDDDDELTPPDPREKAFEVATARMQAMAMDREFGISHMETPDEPDPYA